MTLGKNLLQGKKLGSGALKGVLRAGITPGSGVGAGLGLAGALAGRSKNPNLQKLGKGLGMAGSVAGLFTGGGGAGALGGLAGKFAGSGAGQAASKFAGNFAGLDKTLGGIGAASGGNPLMALAQNFMPGVSGANGMRVKSYEDGGVVEKEPPSVNSLLEALGTDDERGLNQLLNQQYREDMKSLEQEGNEGEGGIDKEQLNKILKALAAGGVGGGVGLAAMVGMPKLVNLLKKAKDPINSDELYHNVDDPMPADPGPYKFRNPFNQSSGGRRQ